MEENDDNRIHVVYRTTRAGLSEDSSDVYVDRTWAIKRAEKLAKQPGVHGAAIVQSGSVVASFGRLPTGWVPRQ